MGVNSLTVTRQRSSCDLNPVACTCPFLLLLSSRCHYHFYYCYYYNKYGWLGSRVVSMLDSGAEGPGFKPQLLRCRVTVLGKLFTPIVPLFTKEENW